MSYAYELVYVLQRPSAELIRALKPIYQGKTSSMQAPCNSAASTYIDIH